MIIFNVFTISHANDLKSNHHQMKPGDWKYMLTEVSSKPSAEFKLKNCNSFKEPVNTN